MCPTCAAPAEPATATPSSTIAGSGTSCPGTFCLPWPLLVLFVLFTFNRIRHAILERRRLSARMAKSIARLHPYLEEENWDE